jgi:FHA domain containing protein
MTVRWTPGTHRALVWEAGMALVDAQVSDEQAEQVWLSMLRDPQLGTFLQVLMEATGTGLLTIPAFAVTILSEGAHVAVRGPLRARITSVDGDTLISGQEVTTWDEKHVAGPVAVELSADDAGGRSLPLIAGLTDASRLVWDGRSEQQPTTTPPVTSAPRKPEPEEAEARKEEAGTASPVSENPESVEKKAEQKPDSDEDDDAEAGASAAAPAPVSPKPPESQESDAEEEADEAEPEGPVTASQPAVPAEPVIQPEQIPTLMPDPTHADPAADDSVAESASSSTDSSARRAGPYDAMWDDSQLLEEEPESSVPQKLEELRHGETIADEDAEVAVTAVPSRNGIEVLAVVCDNGHPNPPQRATCYTCDAPVGGQPRQMPRPQLGWLRINGGEKVPLLGPVVAGRNPQSRVISAETTPRLVALPHAHVSSSHIAFLLEGWTVLARDLGSRNGSYLRRHGKPPMRMPEQDVPLVPGDVVDLGHGVFINVERIP